ncbi:MAG: potassium transporter TrkA [Flavobacteriales bacterium]|nr:potassium transporter TrkA [Flavobacteriales bacterium]
MIKETIIFLAAFLLISISANRIAKLFQKIGLPFITGVLFVGILSGPFVLKMFPKDGHLSLSFINEMALAFIAFAAGSELYLKELRTRLGQISLITVGQLLVTFLLSASVVYFLAERIPFMGTLSNGQRMAIAILMGTIFVARSPSSAIAVINELRAKGPFTQTALGVTVIIDVLVVILFAIAFALSKSLVNNDEMGIGFAVRLAMEQLISFGIGYALGKLLALLFSTRLNRRLKSVLLLGIGYSVYVFSHIIRKYSLSHLGHEVFIEPLLICIIASFVVANFSKYRLDFHAVIEEVGPYVYVGFFTLTGLSLSFDRLISVWEIAVVLFAVRLGSIIIGSLVGGALARDSWKFNLLGWMPYVTQAGVGIGLATIVAVEFTQWGEEFLTLVIGVIVINQVIGPPLFKWAIKYVKEDHLKAQDSDGNEVRDAIIFGYETQAVSLAKQLKNSGWDVKIATLTAEETEISGIPVVKINAIEKEELNRIECEKANTVVTLLSDEQSLALCEIAYENMGTRNFIVRLNERENFEKFHELGARIVEPNTAMVGLLDHFVRSPKATSLLLGMEPDQDSLDIEVTSPEIHGMALRDLRFPSDVLILSVNRNGSALVSHGFTRLRIGDIVTVVGSINSLDKVRLKLDS